MLNSVILIGRLTRDPELRYTSSGVAVASFTLAVERPFSNEKNQREVDFIDIVVWRKLAEVCANHLGKGRLVNVTGSLRIRSYDGSDGQKRKAAEVVADGVRFLDRAKDESSSRASGNAYGGKSSETPQFDSLDLDDDIPF